MRKIFSAKRNALLSLANFSWGTLALAFALCALLVRLVAPNLFWQVFAPTFRVADTFAGEIRFLSDSLGNAAALSLQNDNLAKENAALADENKTLLKKVNDVSALLGFSAPQKGDPGILAGVLARPPESPYDTLVLAAGKSTGVVRGMEAYGAGGVPLGIVTDVLDDFSRATLFSAPGMLTYGWVGAHATIPVTITGAGAGTMNASVPRSAGIVVGDSVFVPGPGMLPIGSVTRVDSDPSSPSVTLRILPLLNPFSVTWVVIRNVGTSLVATSTS
ncbi:rod shape-determining protein MreC [Patescibacteria group bacterium]|nr:rod shape-determining protein MreC [Patescibacteria group bacterium]MDE2021907.1 rod shape-determining protein MreC [Patescibacteria group bacterium]